MKIFEYFIFDKNVLIFFAHVYIFLDYKYLQKAYNHAQKSNIGIILIIVIVIYSLNTHTSNSGSPTLEIAISLFNSLVHFSVLQIFSIFPLPGQLELFSLIFSYFSCFPRGFLTGITFNFMLYNFFRTLASFSRFFFRGT